MILRCKVTKKRVKCKKKEFLFQFVFLGTGKFSGNKVAEGWGETCREASVSWWDGMGRMPVWQVGMFGLSERGVFGGEAGALF